MTAPIMHEAHDIAGEIFFSDKLETRKEVRFALWAAKLAMQATLQNLARDSVHSDYANDDPLEAKINVEIEHEYDWDYSMIVTINDGGEDFHWQSAERQIDKMAMRHDFLQLAIAHAMVDATIAYRQYIEPRLWA